MEYRVASMACLVVIMSVLQGIAADTLVVGDSLGWAVPTSNTAAYQEWSARQEFKIGDILVFNWTSLHDVQEVSKSDYDSCTKTNAIGTVYQTSPVNISLTANTTRYFICTISTHCESGQKVTIGFNESSSSSASSLTFGALSAALFTIPIYVFI